MREDAESSGQFWLSGSAVWTVGSGAGDLGYATLHTWSSNAKLRCLVDNAAEGIVLALHGGLDVLHFLGRRNVGTLQNHLNASLTTTKAKIFSMWLIRGWLP